MHTLDRVILSVNDFAAVRNEKAPPEGGARYASYKLARCC